MKKPRRFCFRLFLNAVFALSLCLSGIAQETAPITGTVKNSNGNLLAGVSIRVKGTKVSRISKDDGTFSISAPIGSTLLFSYIGYRMQEVAVTSSALDIVLIQNDSAVAGNDVVVTALGISREKRAVGYSVETIKGDDVAKSNAPNVINALSGRMAGVNITSPNGVDGGSTRILIGGNNTIQGDNQPLIIIDGMPMSNDLSTSSQDVTAPKDWGSPINLINAADIQDMTVLKGPAAAALYGGRGANGVILITTKKGAKKDGLGIDYNVNYKAIQPYRYLQMQNEYGAGGMVSLNAPAYLKNGDGKPMIDDGWTGQFVDPVTGTGPYGIDVWNQVSWTGSGVSWGPKMDGTQIQWWDGSTVADVPQPNNIKDYYQNGSQVSHTVTVNGGNEFGTIRASYTRLDNTAIIPNSDYNQNTFNIGSNMKLSKRLSMQITASYFVNTYHNAPQLGNAENAFQSDIVYAYARNYHTSDQLKYQNADGSRNSFTGYTWAGNGNAQYLYWNTYMNNETEVRRKLLGSAQLNYQATDFLDLMVRAGTDANNNEFTTMNTPPDVAGVQGYYSKEFLRDNTFNFDWLASFHKDNISNSGLNGKFSVGGTAYQRNVDGLSAINNSWAVPYLYSLSFYTNPNTTAASEDEYIYRKKMNSLYAFLNLSYKSWLYLDVTGRNDWSSALPKGQWSYFFPSVSGSFIFTDALHIKSDVLTYGKIRAAWAEAATDPQPYQVNYTYDAKTFAGQPAISLPSSLPAKQYKPAINRTLDLGAVLGFFRNRLNIDARYYHGKSINQILNSPLPISSGVSNIVVNTGVLENSGIEVVISGKPIDNKNFKWDVSLNLAHNNNKLLSLSEGLDRVPMNNIWGANGVYIDALVGHQFGEIMSYDYVRDKQGRPVLQDAATIKQNFGVSDATAQAMVGTMYEATTDIVPIGNSTPKITGGILNTFTFKGGWSVSALVDAKIGGDVWSGTYASMMQQGLAPQTLKERNGGGLPYTTPDGTQTNWGVVLPGVYPDGTVNTQVVHYYYKYIPYGVWSSGPNGSNWIHSTGVLNDTWIKMREITVNYAIPQSIVKATKIFQAATISLVGRDLFYIHSSLPDHINPEGVNGVGNAQGIEFASLPGVRSFGIQARVSF